MTFVDNKFGFFNRVSKPVLFKLYQIKLITFERYIMKKSLAVLLFLLPSLVSAGSLYSTPYKSANHPDSSKIKSHRNKLNSKINALKQHINQLNQVSKLDSKAAAQLGHKTLALQSAINEKTAAEKNCPVGEFCKLVFSQEENGFGDMQMNPFGKGTDYKINALNYSVYLGEEMTLPFQVYIAQVSKKTDKKTSNTKSMLDPTQGLSVQLPWLYRWGGNIKGGFCNFQVQDGHCIGGGDMTFRYLELSENDGSANTKDSTKGVMAFSAGFGAAIMVPFFQSDVSAETGHLSLTTNLRANYHNHDQPDKLFGPIRDGNNNPVKFNQWFSTLSIGGEFAVNDAFTVKFEYFKPLSNTAHLDEVFKVSFTMNKF